MRKPLKQYDALFKRDAVDLLLPSDQPLKALGILSQEPLANDMP